MPIVGAHGRGGHKEGPGRLELFDFDTLQHRGAEREGRALRARATITDARSCATASACARCPPTSSSTRAIRRRSRTRRRARADGSISTAFAPPSIRAPSGGRSCAKCGACSAITSGRPSMSGVDWNAVYEKYAPLLARVSSRGELSDLIWEMQGELGTSHAYEMGGDHRKPPAWPLGPARRAVQARGRRRELRDREHRIRGPVGPGRGFAAQRDRRRGEGGRAHRRGQRPAACRESVPPQALLVHQANTKVELTIDGANGASARWLRRPWPTKCRRAIANGSSATATWVHAKSNGRVGYFHLPDMQSAGFAEFHRYFSVGVRPRRADRRLPLQPRRPRLAVPAREDRAQAARAMRCRAG